jgi:hypothetical protein
MFYTKKIMQLLSGTQQKRSTKIKTSKDVRKPSASHSRVTKISAKTITRAPKKVSPTYSRKLKRYAKQGVKSILLSPTFHSAFKILSVAFISFGLLYASYFFIGKTFANEVIVSQSEIIARVSKLTPLPSEVPYEVVRVQDETDLRKQNVFYKDIKEGDYILIYRDLAVIYDLRDNVIVGIKRTGDR